MDRGPGRPRRWLPALELAVTVLLVVSVAAALAVQWNVGRADNGDFTRIMTWLTSRPVGFSTNWPPADSPEWPLRFGRHYLSEWAFDPGFSRVLSSVALLWVPGAAINYLLVSQEVLHLGVMSIAPRLLLAATPVGLAIYLRRREADAVRRLAILLLAGVPLALVITNRDYVSFLNSFYQEAGSITYLVAFIAAVLATRAWPRRRTPLIAAAALLALLSASKMSTIYWPWVGGAALALALGWRDPRRLLALVVAALIFSAAGYVANVRSIDPRVNTFHAVFNGMLDVSSDPERRLGELGYPPGAIDCVGQSAFLPRGQACLTAYGARVSRADQVRIVAAEPAVLLGALEVPASAMQEAWFGLGEFPIGGAGTLQESWQLAAWSHLKRGVMPTGAALLAVLAVMAAAGALSIRRSGIRGDLGLVLAMLAAATLVDMAVAFVGDGRQELSKHLLLANWLFDLAVVTAIALAVAWMGAPSADAGPTDLPS